MSRRVLSFVASFLLSVATPVFAQTTFIMPLGNSITSGVGSTGNALSYRKYLWKMLDPSYSVDFVGTLNDGDGTFDQDHEGHPGWRASRVRTSVGGWLSQTNPNMVLLHIGTNDISAGHSTQRIMTDINGILNKIWAHNSQIRVFLCSLVPRSDSLDAATRALNSAIAQRVNELENTNPITFVDQYNAIASRNGWQTSLMSDEIHPNNSGYRVMAREFFDILTQFISPVTPVELTTFTATAAAEGILLRWHTASESNNLGFAVEHRVNDEPFTEIAFVPGAGTVSSDRDYHFLHRPQVAGRHQYRLRQIDTDGTFSYSPIVEAVFSLPGAFTLHPVYPNPFSIHSAGADGVTISYELAEAANISVRVFDVLGRNFMTLFEGESHPGRHRVTWSGRGRDGRLAPSGTYFIRIDAPSGMKSQKLQLVR